ncbi:hypothetical protein HDU81_002106 [Chytriomyces hyalinus]|nr:hypothetical protein HDU81_002106 [Chytriomyces hyalinus]
MRRQYGRNADTETAKATGARPGRDNPNPTSRTSKHTQRQQDRTDPSHAVSLQTIAKPSKPFKKVFPVVFYNFTEWTVDFDASRRANSMASYLFPQGEEQFAIVTFDGEFSEAALGKDMLGLTAVSNPAKFIKYSGLLFNDLESRPYMLVNPSILHDEFIIRNEFNFTDGCGKISADLAHKFSGNSSPCFQVRLPGVKGVLVVDPTLLENTILLRPSMKKLHVRVYGNSNELVMAGGAEKKSLGAKETSSALEAASVPISIIGTSKPSLYGALNAQIIGLLLDRGVPLELYPPKTPNTETLLNFATIDIRAAFDLLQLTGRVQQLSRLLKALLHQNARDLHRVWNEIRDIQRFEDVQMDERINRHGYFERRCAIGEAGTFTSCSPPATGFQEIVWSSGCFRRCITGPVLVVRNPCYHPGDVILLEAVQVPDLNHLVDVLVFSTKGARPPADMSRPGGINSENWVNRWLAPYKPKYQADSTRASRFTANEMRDLLTAMFTVGVDSLDVDVSAMIAAIHLEIYNSQTANLSVHYMLLEMIKTTTDSAARFIKSIELEDFCWDFFESSVNEDLFWKQVDLVKSFCPPMKRENISITAKAIKLLDKIISQQPQETAMLSARLRRFWLISRKLEQDFRRAKSGFAGVEDLYHQIAELDSEDVDATTRQMKKVAEYSKQSEAAKAVMD